jgi:hypothetical protein
MPVTEDMACDASVAGGDATVLISPWRPLSSVVGYMRIVLCTTTQRSTILTTHTLPASPHQDVLVRASLLERVSYVRTDPQLEGVRGCGFAIPCVWR